jgi:Protein of unknown function (DUF5818)
MRKTLAGAGSCLLVAVLLAHASDEKPQMFRGEIGDTQCALNVHSMTRSHTEMLKSKKMGGTPGACASYCVQYLGGDFVLSTKREVYRLDNQEKVSLFAGQRVKITGTLESKTKTIHIVDIEPAE